VPSSRLPAALKRSQSTGSAFWCASAGAAPAMTSAASPSELRPPLAWSAGSGLGAATNGVTGALQLAELDAFVMQATPVGEQSLPLPGTLGDTPSVIGDCVLHPHVLGQLLDVLKRG